MLLLETSAAFWEAPLPQGGADAAGVRSLGFRAVVEQARRRGGACVIRTFPR